MFQDILYYLKMFDAGMFSETALAVILEGLELPID
jgi:hypothetical protein